MDSLVGKVREERALANVGGLGDFGDGGFVESLLDKQVQRGLENSLAGLAFPPFHARFVAL